MFNSKVSKVGGMPLILTIGLSGLKDDVKHDISGSSLCLDASDGTQTTEEVQVLHFMPKSLRQKPGGGR